MLPCKREGLRGSPIPQKSWTVWSASIIPEPRRQRRTVPGVLDDSWLLTYLKTNKHQQKNVVNTRGTALRVTSDLHIHMYARTHTHVRTYTHVHIHVKEDMITANDTKYSAATL